MERKIKKETIWDFVKHKEKPIKLRLKDIKKIAKLK